MDPNKTPQLDPKLKEAYDRVMNATVTQPVGQGSPPTPPAAISPNPTSPNPLGAPPPPPPLSGLNTNSRPDIASNPISEAPHAPEPLVSTSSAGTIASKFPAYKAGTLKAKRSGNVPTILWVLLAAVFFVAYTLIWIRVLGVSLPFLP